ncbi:MAG: rhamnogalacturonan acetylesterase [Melioribacteraceae bacterium]|nr:rhamnogalacturonan acetylesterase [Melioribacteraceae bacterium]MCF8264975.1 rhamnogalacturonan acetylesterase [Melioribacteraceae bacterium]MCF8431628.1 rhamnogalacturonan acetylesterase [Melioribacteraceae bacterium]
MKLICNVLLLFILISCSQEEDKITIFLAGDSTIAKKLESKRPETGWGEKFDLYFNQNVSIQNHAKNGRSTRTFIEENRWETIRDFLHPGDYVFIQFGHNDQAKSKVDRYTPPADFVKNLEMFVSDVRDKKANPVLITPVARRRFDQHGQFYDSHKEYPDLVRSVAEKLSVEMIDLHKVSMDLLKELGEENSKELFLWVAVGESPNYPEGKEDNTHFSPKGAEIIAGLVATEIKKNGFGLKEYLLNQSN